LFIGGIIVYSSARVVLDSVHVLMEGTPAHLDAEEIRRSLRGLPGVADVHDLHLWSLGGNAPLLTAHLVVDLTVRGHGVLLAAPAHGGEGKIAPWLLSRLSVGGQDSCLVLFDDASSLGAAVSAAGRGEERGHAVYELLRQRARSSQADVRRELAKAGVPFHA